MYSFPFSPRHIAPKQEDLKIMLKTIGVKNLQQLIQETIPADIQRQTFQLDKPKTEQEYIKAMQKIASQNKVYKNFIGQGYYGTHTPPIILRNIFENPSWYTAYTPYQAEISQGRMEAILNYQTMVADLTGMEIANASLLDESTACAEAMTMAKRLVQKNHTAEKNKFFVDENLFQHNKNVLITRAAPLQIELVFGDYKTVPIDEHFFGGIVQYPNQYGSVEDFSLWIKKLQQVGALSVVATDLLALMLLKSPGEIGVDIAVGNSQRFGVPLGFGGPHAAFFATKKDFIREIPGRIIGVSVDAIGNIAYRMTLQTREQHIKRDKATSNICTAQALLAIMASMYAVYHGKAGLLLMAQSIHHYAYQFQQFLQQQHYTLVNTNLFDTITIKTNEQSPFQVQQIKERAAKAKMNLHFHNHDTISISFDETTNVSDVVLLSKVFSNQKIVLKKINAKKPTVFLAQDLIRKRDCLTHQIFHHYTSETALLRYIKHLENKDLSLADAMIPLGSCTMKLNATSEMIPLSWKAFTDIHPYAPLEQAQGYMTIIETLKKYLQEITAFDDISFQPNSGAQGEYAGLMVIREYFKYHQQTQRHKILIPVSAHGTNPASAAMCGFDVIVVRCDEKGNIDAIDLKEKAEQHQNELAGLMITYPSTHGVYEEGVRAICELVHQHGGLVYMDGANMNAQVGLTSPAHIGADVCHLNLHKTFSIPHGGGGPGMGPIGVNKKLAPFLPQHHLLPKTNNDNTLGAVSAAPFGSALILLISYGYIQLLGTEGCKNASVYAILNANYIKAKIQHAFTPLYVGQKNRVAHELILDLREFKKTANIDAIDVAKRLIDFSFHPPTLAFPVPGTIMIEPTESEPKEELDRFCDALICIRKEIQEIEEGQYQQDDNVLKNAPHPIQSIATSDWQKKYTREKAVYPQKYLQQKKFWPRIARINDTYGDRNIFCTCPSLELE